MVVPQETPTGSAEGLVLCAPVPQDASGLWRLARDSGLDVNSPYAYLLICSHFAATSVVARHGSSGPVGFLAAYRPPPAPRSLFIWQVAVVSEMRGRRLSRRMLDEILSRPDVGDITHVEATIAPDNAASQGLLRSLARDHGAPLSTFPAFASSLFPEPGHADEVGFRVGPLTDRADPNRPTAEQTG